VTTVDAVSCASAGNCAAGGEYDGQAFVVDETGGVSGQRRAAATVISLALALTYVAWK
jgi:hypothetical protein